MAVLTTLQGFGSSRPRLHGRRVRYFGDCSDDFGKRHDDIMAKWAALAKANNNTLTWEMNLARAKELSVVQAEEWNCYQAKELAKKQSEQNAAAAAAAAAASAAAGRAAASAASAAASHAASEAAKRRFEAEGWNKPVETPPVVTATTTTTVTPVVTPAPLVNPPPSPDVVEEPGAADVTAKPNFLVPLLAFGAAYLFLKG